MPEIMPFLAENDGKSAFDALETVFFIVVALISVFGSIAGKFLKKKKSGDDDAPAASESVFGTVEEEEDDDGNAARDYGNVPRISDEEREAEESVPAGVSAPPPFPNAVPATAAVVSVPAERKSAPERPARRKSVSAASPTDGLLDDREALRRAVLAQEILSPPLALRE